MAPARRRDEIHYADEWTVVLFCMYVQQVHVSEEYCIARFIILTVLLSPVSWVFLFSFSSFFYFSGSSSRLVIFSLRPIRYRTTHSNHLQHSCRVLSPPSIHPSIPPQPPPPSDPSPGSAVPHACQPCDGKGSFQKNLAARGARGRAMCKSVVDDNLARVLDVKRPANPVPWVI